MGTCGIRHTVDHDRDPWGVAIMNGEKKGKEKETDMFKRNPMRKWVLKQSMLVQANIEILVVCKIWSLDDNNLVSCQCL